MRTVEDVLWSVGVSVFENKLRACGRDPWREPCGAEGTRGITTISMVSWTNPGGSPRYPWPTVVAFPFANSLVDKLEPPARDIESPLRLPISNVFKGQGSGTGITGRICGGIVQVGERLRVLPGDETAVVKCKDKEAPIATLPNAVL